MYIIHRVFEGASQQGPKTVTEAEKADIAGGVSAYVQAVQRLLQVRACFFPSLYSLSTKNSHSRCLHTCVPI